MPAIAHGTTLPTARNLDCTATPKSPVWGSRAMIENVIGLNLRMHENDLQLIGLYHVSPFLFDRRARGHFLHDLCYNDKEFEWSRCREILGIYTYYYAGWSVF